MGSMYRLKAYFGMVPAEDMAEYADEPPKERYAGRRREYPGDRWGDSDYAGERDYGAEREYATSGGPPPPKRCHVTVTLAPVFTRG